MTVGSINSLLATFNDACYRRTDRYPCPRVPHQYDRWFAYLMVVSQAIVGEAVALLAGAGNALLQLLFLAPIHKFTLRTRRLVALTAFFITALAVGQLSARAKRRAEEAEAGRLENRRLFEELQEAFDRATEAEALRRSERIKSALLDAVTHDLRTPLTSIKASATLLLEDGEQAEAFTPAEQKTMLRLISDDADRLDSFVESIVDLARIEAGDIKLSRNWGSVEDN